MGRRSRRRRRRRRHRYYPPLLLLLPRHRRRRRRIRRRPRGGRGGGRSGGRRGLGVAARAEERRDGILVVEEVHDGRPRSEVKIRLREKKTGKRDLVTNQCCLFVTIVTSNRSYHFCELQFVCVILLNRVGNLPSVCVTSLHLVST